MSNSRLIWKDSMDKLNKKHIKRKIKVELFLSNFLLFMFLIGFILTGNFFILIVILLLIILDILILKEREIKSFEIHNDRIIYSEISRDSATIGDWGGVNVRKRIIKYEDIENIGPIELEPYKGLIKEAEVHRFTICLKGGGDLIIDDNYISDIHTLHVKLNNQLKMYSPHREGA